MPIVWDSPLTAAVAQELHQGLAGARLRGHRFDWERRELRLQFQDRTLTWALHAGAGWVTLSEEEDPGQEVRPLSAYLVEVTAPQDERWMVFRFRKLRGLTRRVEVIVELMTHQWNGLLVEGPERWIRHILWTRHLKDRNLAVGQAYRPPRPSGRRGIDPPLSKAELEAQVGRLLQEQGPEGVLSQLAFTSPLNLPTLLGSTRSESSDRPPAPGTNPGVDYDFWMRLRTLTDPDPHYLESTQSRQAYPYYLKGFDGSRLSTVLEAVRVCAKKEGQARERSSSVAVRVERALHQAQGRIRGLQRELNQTGDPSRTRERANLLLARLGEVERGTATARLRGFDGEEVLIRMDPSLSPHENAEALYEEAARQERALERIPKLLKRARARETELESLQRRLENGDMDPAEVASHLPERKDRGQRHRTTAEARLPYRTFTSSGGLEIRVGRGPRDNDALTFRHAGPEDVWLHARDTSGAHVILKWARSETPPARDLQEAAVLAALHSSARNAGVVPVDWTWRKYVRKPRKAPAGAVRPERVKTLFVKPDPDLPQRLEKE